MVSTRYAGPVIALLALAAVPTIIHSYLDTGLTDGRRARAIPTQLDGKAGTPTTRRPDWGEDRIASSDWIERNYNPGRIKLFVGRSLDPKRLYHHPELLVDYGEGYDTSTTIRLPARWHVPIHVLRTGPDRNGRLAVYTLRSGDEYVEDPIGFQIRTSFKLLFTRRQPMTLFFAAQDLPHDTAVESSSAISMLLAAMDAFERQADALGTQGPDNGGS